jgi:hypothetical protein
MTNLVDTILSVYINENQNNIVRLQFFFFDFYCLIKKNHSDPSVY